MVLLTRKLRSQLFRLNVVGRKSYLETLERSRKMGRIKKRRAVVRAAGWGGREGGHYMGEELVLEPLEAGGKELFLTVSDVGGVNNNFVWRM